MLQRSMEPPAAPFNPTPLHPNRHNKQRTSSGSVGAGSFEPSSFSMQRGATTCSPLRPSRFACWIRAAQGLAMCWITSFLAGSTFSSGPSRITSSCTWGEAGGHSVGRGGVEKCGPRCLQDVPPAHVGSEGATAKLAGGIVPLAAPPVTSFLYLHTCTA